VTNRAARRSRDPFAAQVRRDLSPADLARIVSLPDFEDLAAERMDEIAYDYVAGGSWDEVSLANNEESWLHRTLRPRVLTGVSRVDPTTTLLGSPVAFPVAIAPMAAHGLAHPDGELASARAAAVMGVPFTLSTMSSRSIEEVAVAAPDGTRWFQLYTQVDPRRSRRFVERAAAAGYSAILLTVDLPVLAYRERDRRNRFELTTQLGNFQEDPTEGVDALAPALLTAEQTLAKDLAWEDLAMIRSWSALPLVLKGILTAEDARLAVDHGVDAIVVSNHGARQLDRVAAPIDVVEEVVEAVGGRAEIWIDGGVRRGLDIAIALALGARGVLIGRPVLWSLAAGGQSGVERVLAILREEFEITLALLGAPTPAGILRGHVAG
jgi:isopentenyl diphosphate isomerase/L-lactate dehydrogenase-like FMN-dependent dehydrogenase